jgi:hypothetical protein
MTSRCVALFGDQSAKSRRGPRHIAKLPELLHKPETHQGPSLARSGTSGGGSPTGGMVPGM